MKIMTIVEDNPITGVRYGTVEVSEYNDNVQRRIDRYYRLRNKTMSQIHRNRIRQK